MARNDSAKRGERMLDALELRRAGKTYREIAFLLKCETSTAFRNVRAALLELRKEPAEEVKELELARYDRYLDSIDTSINGDAVCPECGRSDLKAIEVAIKLSKARRELLGLDAPTKTETKDTTEKPRTKEELWKRIEELKAKQAEEGERNGPH